MNGLDELVLLQLIVLFLKTTKSKTIRFSTLEVICKILECQSIGRIEFVKDE